MYHQAIFKDLPSCVANAVRPEYQPEEQCVFYQIVDDTLIEAHVSKHQIYDMSLTMDVHLN